MMLRKRSRPITDHNKNNSPSPNSDKSQKPTSFFKDLFMSRDQSTTSMMSPSSVLDTKPISPKSFSWEQPGIGLVLFDDHPQVGPINTSKSSKQRTKLVVFGSHLKIQIPPTPPQLPTPPSPTSPQSPMEFGIKTPKSNLLGHVFAKSVLQQEEEDRKRLSVNEMELSEDYTCVISHGPNPKTTHIFGNCIVKSCCGVASNINVSGSSSSTINGHGSHGFTFLSFCYHCNKKIGQGNDIYMYRGEKAFCSQECRSQEMLMDGIEC